VCGFIIILENVSTAEPVQRFQHGCTYTVLEYFSFNGIHCCLCGPKNAKNCDVYGLPNSQVWGLLYPSLFPVRAKFSMRVDSWVCCTMPNFTLISSYQLTKNCQKDAENCDVYQILKFGVFCTHPFPIRAKFGTRDWTHSVLYRAEFHRDR